jgi:formate dehydrogenase assembly factor FdhD
MSSTDAILTQGKQELFKEYQKMGGRMNSLQFSGAHPTQLPYKIAKKLVTLYDEWAIAGWQDGNNLPREQAIKEVASGRACTFCKTEKFEPIYKAVQEIYKSKTEIYKQMKKSLISQMPPRGYMGDIL